MPENTDNSKEALASYLKDNDWAKELNYKLWVTKGARFCAAKRLETVADASTKAITFLSAYLIILGLIPTFIPAVNDKVPAALLGVSIVSISILVLVYSLIESSRRYTLRSHLYHTCAVQIGKYYNALRQAKEIDSSQERSEAIRRITADYERTLDSHENHSDIDSAVFRTQKPEYFKLTRTETFWINVRSYYETTFRYHALILAPPLVITIFYLALR